MVEQGRWQQRVEQANAFVALQRSERDRRLEEILEKFEVRSVLEMVGHELWGEGEIVEHPSGLGLCLVSNKLRLIRRTQGSRLEESKFSVVNERVSLSVVLKTNRDREKQDVGFTLTISDKGVRSNINHPDPEDWKDTLSLSQILDSVGGISRNRVFSNPLLPVVIEVGDIDSRDAIGRFNLEFVKIVQDRQKLNDLPGQLRQEEDAIITRFPGALIKKGEQGMTRSDLLREIRKADKAQQAASSGRRKGV